MGAGARGERGSEPVRRSVEISVSFYTFLYGRLRTKGEVAKSLGNQARGVQPACTMTTQKFKNQVDKYEVKVYKGLSKY